MLLSAVLAAVWGSDRLLAQGVFAPSSGSSLYANRPTRTTNTQNRVGFQNVGQGRGGYSRPATNVARPMANPMGGFSASSVRPGSYPASAGRRPLPGTGAAFAGRPRGTRRVVFGDLGAMAAARRPPRGQLDVSRLPMSRYWGGSEANDLPFTAAAVREFSQDVTVVDGGRGTGLVPGWPAALSAEEADPSQATPLDEVLQRRIVWRQGLLVSKGRAEFQEGNWQRAFSQFVLADRIEGDGEKNPKRLVVLSSIATGNFSLGSLELTRLLAEDATLFTEPYYGVDWLYTDPGQFRGQLEELKDIHAREGGNPAPRLLYAYALWLAGESREAVRVAQAVIDDEPNPALAMSARQLLEGITGQPMAGSEQGDPAWRLIGR